MRRGVCTCCGERLDAAQDPEGDEPGVLEVWCPNERACEQPDCTEVSCDTEVMAQCDSCAVDYCRRHLTVTDDGLACPRCMYGEEPK